MFHVLLIFAVDIIARSWICRENRGMSKVNIVEYFTGLKGVLVGGIINFYGIIFLPKICITENP